MSGVGNKDLKESKYETMINQKFGRWTLIEYLGRDKWYTPIYKCQCDCKNIKNLSAYTLVQGATKSCGCLRKEKSSSRRKCNEYDLSGKYGVGYASNNKGDFYFDLEDYDKIKDYTWYMTKDGYMHSRINNKIICLHRLILGVADRKILVDHIGHTPYDNRKANLRKVTVSQNQMNKKKLSNNTSGITGVSFHKQANKWRASIDCNGKQIHLGLFNTLEEATEARIKAEEKYHKEYSYDKSMKFYENVLDSERSN